MIRLKAADLQKQKIDTLIVPVCEDKEIHDERIIKGVIKKALQLKEFKAEKGDRVTLYNYKNLAIERIICVGLGKLKKIDHEVLRAFCGTVVNRCMQAGFEKIWVAVPAAKKLKMEMPDVVEAKEKETPQTDQLSHQTGSIGQAEKYSAESTYHLRRYHPCP
jgi:leucyl aminopeptidase